MLIIQRALSFDDQDVALGMNTHCLTNEVQATVYGGVREYCILDRRLALELSDEAARALELSAHVSLRFPSDPPSIESGVLDSGSLEDAVREILQEAREVQTFGWL